MRGEAQDSRSPRRTEVLPETGIPLFGDRKLGSSWAVNRSASGNVFTGIVMNWATALSHPLHIQ